MNILGINAFHGDSSAALLIDGKLIAAVEEERYNRIKHWAGLPIQSIQYCLDAGNLNIQDIDYISLSFDPKKNLLQKLKFAALNLPSPSQIINRITRQRKSLSLKAEIAAAFQIPLNSLRAELVLCGHHESHIASTFLISPFEESSILSIDGMGDFVSTLFAHGKGNQITYGNKITYPHSLGFLYNAITLYLGFPKYGDEYKVMGLAPYGEPEFIDEFRKMILLTDQGFELNLDYFNHVKKGIKMSWNGGEPLVEAFHSPYLEARLGPAKPIRSEMTKREENISASLQLRTEEVIFHLLNILHKKYPSKNLCLSGGVAMNSVSNGKIHKFTPFENVYVPVGAADNGTSFGSAFHVWNTILKKERNFTLEHAYWGPYHENSKVEEKLKNYQVKFEKLEEVELIDRVTDQIIEGKIVGWFQGRMEFGARALGNRSLIADPRREDMRDIINLKIKFREKFRPFAPSILREHVKDYFEDDIESPFMEKVLTIRQDKRKAIPAVTHVDGSGRLQTVEKKTNPLYYNLIESFYKKTNVPILLNTSLNENEPIVCKIEEAIDCFLRTSMDILVINNYYITRK